MFNCKFFLPTLPYLKKGFLYYNWAQSFLQLYLVTKQQVRCFLQLPSIKLRSRSSKKMFFKKANPLNRLSLKKSRFFLAEFYNLVWFIFFTAEWYLTKRQTLFLIKKNHSKNVFFSNSHLKFRKVISFKKTSFKVKKNQRKKKKNNKEFNIGFYYLDTLKHIKTYCKFKQ